MKKMLKPITLLILCIAITSLLCVQVLAVSARDELVVDREGLFDATEEAYLENMLYETSVKYQCELVVLTTSTFNGYSIDEYAESFFDSNGYGYGSDGNGVLLLISEAKREYYICFTGRATEIFSFTKGSKLENAIVDHLKSDEFYEASVAFCETASDILSNDNGFYMGGFVIGVVISVIVAIIAGIITIVVMRRAMNNARPQRNAGQYIRYGSFELTETRDMYLYSHVTRRAKPKSNSSSGGRSHSGRGGRF